VTTRGDGKERRSWLIVPASKPSAAEEASRAGADVVVLDLVEFVATQDRPAARSNMHAAIEAVRTGRAEVFAQIDPLSFTHDLQSCVTPGLAGIVVSRAESADQIDSIAAMLTVLEAERHIEPDSLDIVPALETARGNHAAYDILRASPRVWGATLGRADLIMDLRPEPSGEIHLMPYLMQRLVIVAGAADVRPIGAWWRAPDRGLLATPENTFEAARRGRTIGFKGAMGLRANQVEPLKRAYA
jgi:citrate lyase subunit beta/citryl-CoA lyase